MEYDDRWADSPSTHAEYRDLEASGPLRALLIAWLVCLLPIALGIVSYDYLAGASSKYVWILAVSILAYAAGVLLGAKRAPVRGQPQLGHDWDRDLAEWWPFAKFCLVVAAVANVAMISNFFVIGVRAENLDDIRSQVVGLREGADFSQRVAAVTLWACFVCLAFGLYFRHKLSRPQLALFLAMSMGLFLSSLVSAGRQAVAQLIFVVLFLEAMRNRRLPRLGSARRWSARALLVGLAATVMAFITINRGSSSFGRTKADLYLIFFDAHLSGWFESLIAPFGERVRDFVTELVLYISSSVPLFSQLLNIDFGRLYLGVFDFPFAMRQLEPLTGLSVIESWDIRTSYLSSERVIGTGWTTTPSHLILDYGVVGMAIFLLIQGWISERVWQDVKRGRGFGHTLVCVILTIAAIYLPFLPALSDTSLFLLLIVLTAVLFGKRVHRGRRLEGRLAPAA